MQTHQKMIWCAPFAWNKSARVSLSAAYLVCTRYFLGSGAIAFVEPLIGLGTCPPLLIKPNQCSCLIEGRSKPLPFPCISRCAWDDWSLPVTLCCLCSSTEIVSIHGFDNKGHAQCASLRWDHGRKAGEVNQMDLTWSEELCRQFSTQTFVYIHIPSDINL